MNWRFFDGLPRGIALDSSRRGRNAMKPLVSGLMGALAAGVLMTAWNSRTSAEEHMLVARPAARAVQMGADAAPAGADTNALAPVNVQCAPGQRAVVRQVPTPQGTMADVQCVSAYGDDMVAWNGYAPAAASPRAMPAVYSAPAPQRVVYRDRAERRTSGRSWKKSALVIGGSAGAGAGVGAIAGGKKGALIGAAIGGGAATLYEAIKRK
jgi:hypothetical protein